MTTASDTHPRGQEPAPSAVTIEERGGRWCVIVAHPNGTSAVVGRHTAKYRAKEQAERLAQEVE